MFERYQEWRRYSRQLRDAKALLREGRKCLAKYSYRMTESAATAVRDAIKRLADVVAAKTRGAAMVDALNGLDKALDTHLSHARKSATREYAESIGVAVLIALFLRAFVVEAFKIPSGSMIPTLQVGDHIFVNKFIYGIRIPYTNLKFGTSYRKPRRGEVIVFIYPVDPDKDFIKRIVAVAGDTIEVRERTLYVNGEPVVAKPVSVDGKCRYTDFNEYTEKWSEQNCDQYTEEVPYNEYTVFYSHELGATTPQQKITVPPNHVFVMGDNRDNSSDGRKWGFVPEVNIKGKAMVIWFSTGEPEGGIRWQRMFHLVR